MTVLRDDIGDTSSGVGSDTSTVKNDRFHPKTPFPYLDKQPLPDTLTELKAQIDAFDLSTTPNAPTKDSPDESRPQRHGGATEKAETPPRLRNPSSSERPRNAFGPPSAHGSARRQRPQEAHQRRHLDTGKVTYLVGGQHGLQQVQVITDAHKITVADLEGEILIEHTRPAPGGTYLGNGRPRGPRPKTAEASPKS